jgi:hypothetical protein
VDARSPEELETLLEDAVLLDDAAAVASLFEPAGVLLVGTGPARGPAEIAAAVPSWTGFVADPRTVVRVPGLSLVVGPAATTVARRDPTTGAWRYAMVVPQVP